MELQTNWVEISGRFWSRLTRGWAAASGLGPLPLLTVQLVLVPGCFTSFHAPKQPRMGPFGPTNDFFFKQLLLSSESSMFLSFNPTYSGFCFFFFLFKVSPKHRDFIYDVKMSIS